MFKNGIFLIVVISGNIKEFLNYCKLERIGVNVCEFLFILVSLSVGLFLSIFVVLLFGFLFLYFFELFVYYRYWK